MSDNFVNIYKREKDGVAVATTAYKEQSYAHHRTHVLLGIMLLLTIVFVISLYVDSVALFFSSLIGLIVLFIAGVGALP